MFCKGITSWVLSLGGHAIIWRHNMPLRQAVLTCRQKRFGKHGYFMAGPLIVEW
jgi:hypothetical protein